jgi:hypothetical protein
LMQSVQLWRTQANIQIRLIDWLKLQEWRQMVIMKHVLTRVSMITLLTWKAMSTVRLFIILLQYSTACRPTLVLSKVHRIWLFQDNEWQRSAVW